MAVGEYPARMPRQFRKHAIFLGCQMNRLAAFHHRAAEQVDRHVAGLDRGLIGFGAKLEQIGEIALKLRDF